MWETIGKLFAAIVEKRWLALLLCGLFVFLIGAAGGLGGSLQLNNTIWRTAVVAVGIVLAIVGAYGMVTEQNDEPGLPGENYGLQIIEPGENASVREYIDVEGRYERRPPAAFEVRVFVLSRSRGLYWPSRAPVHFNELTKRWTCSLSLGGRAGEKKLIGVAVLGKNSQVLLNFYVAVIDWAERAGDAGVIDWGKAFNKNLGNPGIPKFPSDFRECHRIQVIRS